MREKIRTKLFKKSEKKSEKTSEKNQEKKKLSIVRPIRERSVAATDLFLLGQWDRVVVQLVVEVDENSEQLRLQQVRLKSGTGTPRRRIVKFIERTAKKFCCFIDNLPSSIFYISYFLRYPVEIALKKCLRGQLTR